MTTMQSYLSYSPVTIARNIMADFSSIIESDLGFYANRPTAEEIYENARTIMTLKDGSQFIHLSDVVESSRFTFNEVFKEEVKEELLYLITLLIDKERSRI